MFRCWTTSGYGPWPDPRSTTRPLRAPRRWPSFIQTSRPGGCPRVVRPSSPALRCWRRVSGCPKSVDGISGCSNPDVCPRQDENEDRDKQLTEPDLPTYHVLALSGGGYRALYSATVLAQLEEALGAPLAKRFDLICGTSAGGMLAIGLAAEIPTAELQALFVDQGNRIFGCRT